MATEDRNSASAGSRPNWRGRVLLAAVFIVLALVPTIVELARGVPFGDAILGVGNWIVGGTCVLGGRIYVTRERWR